MAVYKNGDKWSKSVFVIKTVTFVNKTMTTVKITVTFFCKNKGDRKGSYIPYRRTATVKFGMDPTLILNSSFKSSFQHALTLGPSFENFTVRYL